MKSMLKTLSVLAMCLAFVVPASADEMPLVPPAGLRAGAPGVGPEIAYRFGPYFGLRADFGPYGYKTERDFRSVHYSVDLKLGNGSVMADWYPVGGGFRVSGGLRANGDELDLNATPTTAVQLGATTYTPDQIGTLTGEIAGAGTAPVLSLGYGGTLAKGGLTAGMEVGVVFQGSPRVKNLKASGLMAANPQFQADLASEARKIERDAGSLKASPILQLRLAYRF